MGLKIDWKCCSPWCHGKPWCHGVLPGFGLKMTGNAVLRNVVVSNVVSWCNDGSSMEKLWECKKNFHGKSKAVRTALLKMTNLWMPVTSLTMVRFSIHKKFWKALDLLYQMTVEMTGNNGGNDGNDGGNNRNDRNDGGNHLKMTNLWMPVTSLIMVRFSIRKKFWKALDLLYHMTVETTGKRWGKQQKWRAKWRKQRGKPRTGFLLNIRLGICYPPWFPRGILLFHLVSCLVCGLKSRLEMLFSVVSWFPPPWCHGDHCLVLGSKLDWKCCPPWCRGFHPVVSWCLAWFIFGETVRFHAKRISI